MKRMMGVLAVLALVFSVSAYGEETDPSTQEGYVTELEGYSSEVCWCKNGENSIFGRFYYPEGFDETKTYPTVIMSHGLGSNCDMTEKGKWPQVYTQDGYVAYAFDFCGGGPKSRSDGDYFSMSVRTEQSDLSAVMDFVKEQPFVDTANLFLLGQSQGGFVSAMTAAARPEEVKAMVLVYPALCLVDDLHTFVPDLESLEGDTFESAMGELGTIYARDGYNIDVYGEMAGYTGDVLIIHGLNDKTVPYQYSVDAIEKAYPESLSELILIGGRKSVHGFEMVYDEGREYVQDQGIDFCNRHLG